jgi:hypothetical protein
LPEITPDKVVFVEPENEIVPLLVIVELILPIVLEESKLTVDPPLIVILV